MFRVRARHRIRDGARNMVRVRDRHRVKSGVRVRDMDKVKVALPEFFTSRRNRILCNVKSPYTMHSSLLCVLSDK